MMRTAQEFKQAAITHDITHWDSHDCSICGYTVGYLFEDDHERVLFDHGCDCTGRYVLSDRTWEDVAHKYNIQVDSRVRAIMDKFWGFE